MPVSVKMMDRNTFHMRIFNYDLLSSMNEFSNAEVQFCGRECETESEGK